jgi:hypothetical protein
MRYLVKARVKPGQEKPLLQAIADGTLGQGSIAGDEYVYDLEQARVGEDGVAHWVETCFCATPLAEESRNAGARNRGRVVIATAPNSWKRDCSSRANRF